ncbi:hypothetical protein [Streptomyces sp. NBC_00370]|uniref:hypothetical protein n=1 Tax=Streptomyces sp. NBC_00370 TaxID=2975728 RepID=UPI002E275EAC
MLTSTANRDARFSFWPRVREFAVPASMIETATARRHAGDWAGACAAAGFDVDFRLRDVARTHGRHVAARLRADLRQLAPDLLRWHMPRIAPDGLLRPGLTVALARYGPQGQAEAAGQVGAAGRDEASPVYLVARTAPAWADSGQRISLALWDGSLPTAGDRRHPHPRPDRRFRFDLHRHLWDARRTDELRVRSGAEGPPADSGLELPAAMPQGHHCAVDRWPAEAAILLGAEGPSTGSADTGGTFTVRLASRHRLVLDLVPDRDRHGDGGAPRLRIANTPPADASALPVLPDAATWVPPDLELIRSGSIAARQLHPLVAAALLPDRPPAGGPPPSQDRAGQPRLVECRGAQHRIGLVDGVLVPLDHDPAEIRREELLVALTGTPLPCLRAVDEAHRRPDCLTGVRERLDHGDTAGALAVVEGLLGREAVLRTGALRDELEAAARRRITYGLYRSGLIGTSADSSLPGPRRPRHHRSHPRLTTAR